MRRPLPGEIWQINNNSTYYIDRVDNARRTVTLRYRNKEGGIASRSYGLHNFNNDGSWKCLSPVLIENE